MVQKFLWCKYVHKVATSYSYLNRSMAYGPNLLASSVRFDSDSDSYNTINLCKLIITVIIVKIKSYCLR